jgi:hypothetical protein
VPEVFSVARSVWSKGSIATIIFVRLSSWMFLPVQRGLTTPVSSVFPASARTTSLVYGFTVAIELRPVDMDWT